MQTGQIRGHIGEKKNNNKMYRSAEDDGCFFMVHTVGFLPRGMKSELDLKSADGRS